MIKKFLLTVLSLVMALTVACAVSNESSSGNSGSIESNSAAESGGSIESNSVTESGGSSEGNSSSESEKESSVEPHRHTGVMVEATSATCATDGNIDYWICSGCEKLFSDEACTIEITEKDIVIAASHISLTHYDEVAAVGKDNGSTEYWYCSGCEKYYADASGKIEISQTDTVVIAPLNIPDFIVEVSTGKTPIVLQLTDT